MPARRIDVLPRPTPEQIREQLALHAPAKLGDLLIAPVEKCARLLRERREAEPRVLRIDRGAEASG